MMTTTRILSVLSAFFTVSYGCQDVGPEAQDWGYVTVRPKAHQFWWLYETTANVQNITERPLVIWLQGGPGASSTGFGNFMEIGPLDVDFKPRNLTWIENVNVLFIDNPVGTGFSYTDDDTGFTTTNQQIAEDLVAVLCGFYEVHPEFRYTCLYIASESYGGKMAVDFALELVKQVQFERTLLNLKGVCLIDSWIDPIQSVLTWAPFLYNVGAIDQEGYRVVDAAAQRVKKAIDEGRYHNATTQWVLTENVIMDVAKEIDFYNILKKIDSRSLRAKARKMVKPDASGNPTDDEKLAKIMNGPIKESLKLNVTWGQQSEMVFDKLGEDFMKSVTDRVEKLLNETNITVQVVTGQLDLIVDTPGTVQWVDNLKWTRSNEWKKVPRDALAVNGINEGYVKKLGQFALYWVNRAGHAVPADNPYAMEAILRDLTNNYSGN